MGNSKEKLNVKKYNLLIGAAGIVLVSAAAGTITIRLQKKYGIGQM